MNRYDVRFSRGEACGGGYVKLFHANDDDGDVGDGDDKKASDSDSSRGPLLTRDSPYSVMFGPDKCGNSVRLAFIVQLDDGRGIEWKRATKARRLLAAYKDREWHNVHAVLHPHNGTYTVSVDFGQKTFNGTLTKDFRWLEADGASSKHGDAKSVKHDASIDVNAKQLSEMMQTANAVGFELWTVNGGVQFDNVLVTTNVTLADEVRREIYERKYLVAEKNRVSYDYHFRRDSMQK